MKMFKEVIFMSTDPNTNPDVVKCNVALWGKVEWRYANLV